jgi:hypothetical protein
MNRLPKVACPQKLNGMSSRDLIDVGHDDQRLCVWHKLCHMRPNHIGHLDSGVIFLVEW